MSLNFANLVSQGRAKSIGVCWSEGEWATICDLVKERGIPRLSAADYVRNGILSLEDYDASQKVKFVPKTMEEASKEAEEALKTLGQEAVKKTKKGKK